MAHLIRLLVAVAVAATVGRCLIKRLLAQAAILSLLTACAADQAKDRPKSKRIDQSQSKLDVRIDGLSNYKLRYYYRGWRADYSSESYTVQYRNRQNGQYLFARIDILASDGYFWTRGADVTVEIIKRGSYFKNKARNITFKTKGMNTGYDSSMEGELCPKVGDGDFRRRV